MIKRLFTLSLAVLFLVISLFSLVPPKTQALSGSEFQPGRIIDDSKFFAPNTMGVADIQAFLNSKVPVCETWHSAGYGQNPPFTCLKDFRDTVPARSGESGLCNGLSPGSGTAAEIIYWVSQSCGINPQVLIVLLQKEQSLITDTWPLNSQYRSATGYGCPDTAACDSTYYGYFNQVYMAARQFKRYARDSGSYNNTVGTNSYVLYNPNVACGGSVVYMQNQATAGLYNYTPYQPNPSALANLYGTGDGCGAYGNRNFWRVFNDWFGSTYGPVDYSCGSSGANIAGASRDEKIVSNKLGSGPELLTLTVPNNTGSGCIEAHTWTKNLQGWVSHKATNRPSIDPADGEIITGDTNGDGRDELMVVESRNTSSGHIEVHVWDDSYQRWIAHVASNRPAIDPADSDVIAADTDGNGKDELYLVEYRNTSSGKIEVHGWTPNLQGWIAHVASNYPSIDPANSRIIASDLDGNGRDEWLLINYTGTSSGKIEVHGWTPNLQGWFAHIATSHSALALGDGMVISSNNDGAGSDELLLIRYRNTSSGRIEVHGWMPGLQQWFLHSTTAP